MDGIAARRWTVEEFLAWEERQPTKYEFDGVNAIAMVGVTVAHGVIQANLTTALVTRLRGKPCRFVGVDLKVRVAGSIRYPDGLITCSANANTATIVDGPVTVFEIISPGTAARDRIDKLREYQATASIQRYVMIEQDRPALTDIARSGELWTIRALTQDDTLALPEAGIDLPVAELYADLDLSDPAP